MRCIYRCPATAIDNRSMDFFILKGGYSLKRIRELPPRPIDFGAEALPFMHRYFRKYAESLGEGGNNPSA